MKRIWIPLASLLMFIAPNAAQANIWIPSVVQWIASPVPCSFLIYPLIVTVPLILGISTIEALVVRKHTKHTRLGAIIRELAIINVVTSLFGMVAMPQGTELWPGLPVCYLLTVISECALLFGFADRLRLQRSFRQTFVVSVKMNTASYAFLASLLATMIYVPQMGNESARVAREVDGQLVVIHFNDHFRVLDLSHTLSVLSDEQVLELSPGPGEPADNRVSEYLPGVGRQIIGLMPRKIVKLRYGDGGWTKHFEPLPEGLSDPTGVSFDGRYVCCTMNDGPVVYDLRSKRVVLNLKSVASEVIWAGLSFDNRFVAVADRSCVRVGPSRISSAVELNAVKMKTEGAPPLFDALDSTFSPTPGLAFSPVDNRLAWVSDQGIVIYDCLSKCKKTLRVPGSIDSQIAWSSDGRFIAYVGQANSFTAQRWTPDVRIVDVAVGDSATVHRALWTSGAPCTLVWLR